MALALPANTLPSFMADCSPFVSHTSRWLEVFQLVVVAVIRTALALVELFVGLVTVTTVSAATAKEACSKLNPSTNSVDDEQNLLSITLLNLLDLCCHY
jgi:hypothetical protein